jgi:hypothetical protein
MEKGGMTERLSERERKREKERKVVSFVAYYSLQWEIRKLLAVLPLLLWSNRGPKKSTGIRNQCKDMYLRACPMPDDAPVMRAAAATAATAPPPWQLPPLLPSLLLLPPPQLQTPPRQFDANQWYGGRWDDRENDRENEREKEREREEGGELCSLFFSVMGNP